MGIKISRIETEFIVNKIIENDIPIKINSRIENITCNIKEINETTIIAESQDIIKQSQKDEEVRVFFSFFGHVMSFETKILKSDSHEIVMETPESIYKKLERKYERVKKLKDISVSFLIKSTEISLDFYKVEEYNPVDKPKLSDEFDLTRIDLLMNQFKERVIENITDANILMFRKRKPENYFEEIVSRTGKIVYIPSTLEFPETDFTADGLIVTKRMVVKIEQDEQKSGKTALETIETLLKSKREEGIVAELYCPVIYHEYIVGYIYMVLNKEDVKVKNGIVAEMVEFAHQFAKVVAYSLNMHGYFKGDKLQLQNYTGEIIDISASGVLFAHTSEEVNLNLLIYSDIELNLLLKGRTISIKSRIMRKYKEENISYYGVLFLEIDAEDFKFLFDYVYGRTFTRIDEEMWEGGSPPPTLNVL